MRQAIAAEENQIVLLLCSVDRDAGNAPTNRLWIFHLDSIRGPFVSINDFKIAPEAGDARIDAQSISLQLESENIFQRRPVHPSG